MSVPHGVRESFALCLAAVGLFCIGPAMGGQPASDLILSADLAPGGAAVVIRTAKGTQTLNPASDDTAFSGYEKLVVSSDRHAAVWLEDQGPPVSDANYAEPTGAWLFAHGRLVGSMRCDGGEPFHAYFGKAARTLIVVCSFPHGPPSTHYRTFDTTSARCLFSRNAGSRKRQACGKDT